jgi:predicted RNA-binding protein with PUA-like domain
MKYWLMKTEPDVFSFEDLVKSPNSTTFWEGVRNYQARNLMRDDFKVGHKVVVYHSNLPDPIIPGIAEVVKAGYPDDSALDPKSDYFDPKAKGISPWIRVDIQATHRLTEPVSRSRLKSEPALSGMMVLKKGARLSVQPLSEAEFKVLCTLGKPKAIA